MEQFSSRQTMSNLCALANMGTTVSELRQLAWTCYALADTTLDPLAKDEFAKMAREYENEADEKQREAVWREARRPSG